MFSALAEQAQLLGPSSEYQSPTQVTPSRRASLHTKYSQHNMHSGSPTGQIPPVDFEIDAPRTHLDVTGEYGEDDDILPDHNNNTNSKAFMMLTPQRPSSGTVLGGTKHGASSLDKSSLGRSQLGRSQLGRSQLGRSQSPRPSVANMARRTSSAAVSASPRSEGRGVTLQEEGAEEDAAAVAVRRKTHLTLPDFVSLRGLPETTKAEIKSKAAYRLALLMSPVLKLKRKALRRSRLSLQRFAKDTPTAALTLKMKELPLFDDWPPEAFTRLHQVAQRESYEQHAVLSYKNTPAKANAVFVLVNGTAVVSYSKGTGINMLAGKSGGTSGGLLSGAPSINPALTQVPTLTVTHTMEGDIDQSCSASNLLSSPISTFAGSAVAGASTLAAPSPAVLGTLSGAQVVTAPCVFNGWTVIDHTVTNYTVTTASVCDLLVIPGDTFRKLIHTPSVIPKTLASSLKYQAVQDRLGDFEKTSTKLDERALKDSLLFSLGHRTDLSSIARRFTPFCPQDGTVVFKKGSFLHHVYFVEKGTLEPQLEVTSPPGSPRSVRKNSNANVGNTRPSVASPFAAAAAAKKKQQTETRRTGLQSASPPASPRGLGVTILEGESGSDNEEVLERSILERSILSPTATSRAGSTFRRPGEEALHRNFTNLLTHEGGFYAEFHCYFGVRWTGPDYVATGSVRAWSIPRREIQKMCAEAALERLMVSSLRRSVAMLIGKEEATRAAYLKVLQRTPILSQNIRHDALQQVAMDVGFPRLYLPQEVICSRSQACEFFYVVLAGKARVLLDHSTVEINPGDLGGFPLLVSHNWAHSVIALTPVHMMLLTREQLLRFLRRKDPAGLTQVLHWSSVLLRPTRHSAQEALRLTTLLAGTEPATPLYSLDVPVAVEPRDDKIFVRNLVARSTTSKIINEIFHPSKPLAAEVRSGESSVFYKSPRQSGIRAHTSVFQKGLQQQQQLNRDAASPKRGDRASSRGSSNGSPGGGGGNRGPVLAFAEHPQDAYSLNRQVDSTFAKHRNKVDRLWTHSNKQVRSAVTRMYPPVKRGLMSRMSSSRMSTTSVISTMSRSGTTPQSGMSRMLSTSSRRGSSSRLSEARTSSSSSPVVTGLMGSSSSGALPSPRSDGQAPNLKLPSSEFIKGDLMVPHQPHSGRK